MIHNRGVQIVLALLVAGLPGWDTFLGVEKCDLDDPQSNVSQLLARNEHFRMHEELGTGPGFYYLWDKRAAT